MLRGLFSAVFVILFLFVFKLYTFAASPQFLVDTNIAYSIAPDGTATVTQAIRIHNKTKYIYTPTYTFNPALKDIRGIKASNSSGPLPVEVREKADGQETVEISFPKRITGTSKTNDFKLSYQTHDIVKHFGQIWQLSIPGISDSQNYDKYTITIQIPESFGQATIIKPKPDKSFALSASGQNQISFSKDHIGKAGIFLEFGKIQYYSFHLTYHLENPNFFPIHSQIALPPSTNYQDVSIAKLNPVPTNVQLDGQGNWIAYYTLTPHEKKDISLQGVARVNPIPRPEELSVEKRNIYLEDREFWQANSGEIQTLARDLKTPEKIYGYVRTKLTYNYEKVSRDNRRLGAVGALHESKYAVCLEFTDLFVALARAAGIPAREVEGYAYSQNETLKPLSATRDILHTWPEYYDDSKKSWIMVDPTWGNTTYGADYFNSMDFEHIAFVINGDNSTYPIPAGAYKLNKSTKDVIVSFASPGDFVESSRGEIINDLPKFVFSGFPVVGQILIKNTGMTPLPRFDFVVSSALFKQESYSAQNVPPYGTLAVPFKSPATKFLTNASYVVTIQSSPRGAGAKLTHVVTIGIIPNKEFIIIGGVVLIGIASIFIITIKTWRIFISRRKR